MTKKIDVAQGFRFSGGHAGIKVQRKDVALIVSERPATVVGVTTQNEMRAACAARTASLLPRSDGRAVIVNSGNANCLAGANEATNDERLAEAVARALGVTPKQVFTASTGPIGVELQIESIESVVPDLVADLATTTDDAAEAIMTTDKVPKQASRRVELPGGVVTLTAIAKGSGMIHPQMATMLAYICTDAAGTSDALQPLIERAVSLSFNQVSVDRDTSTNDAVLLIANGASGVAVDGTCAPFVEALNGICEELAKAIAADGEGATRLISVEVLGTAEDTQARRLARSVVESNLFKSSVFGDASGWGRALASLGACASGLGLPVDRHRLEVNVNGVDVVREGRPTGDNPPLVGPEARYAVRVGAGVGRGRAWGCDLSYDYVSINAVTKSDPLETHSPGLKRRLLVEALSYIKRFHNRLAVIKYGGAAMVREDLKDAFAEDLVLLKAAGLLPVVVHGGGPEISATLERLGETPRFVDGIRVTDADHIKVVEMVLSGRVNTDVVTRIHTFGGQAIGLSGKDGGLLTARKLAVGGKDVGLVGEVTAVRTEIIQMLLERDYIPVVSPIGVDAKGTTYNINADTVAAEVAVALGAEKIIFLTDVPGVLDGEQLISETSPVEINRLIERGVVRGGMLPKVNALLAAVARGVRSAHIIDGRVPHNLLAELFTEKGVGTWIRAREVSGDETRNQ